MSNCYETITITPSLPRSAVSLAHIELLRDCGFDCEPDGADTLYFCCNESNSSLENAESSTYLSIANGESVPGISARLAQAVKDNPGTIDYADIFLDVLRSPAAAAIGIKEIVAEAAHWGDKARPGEFGGFVVRITDMGIQSLHTSDGLRVLRLVDSSLESADEVLRATSAGLKASAADRSKAQDLFTELRRLDVARPSDDDARPTMAKQRTADSMGGNAMLRLDESEHATILAALRFYQKNGQGNPDNRDDDIHEIATNDDCISLDDDGIDALCEKINFTEGSSQVCEEQDEDVAARDAFAHVLAEECEMDDDDAFALASELIELGEKHHRLCVMDGMQGLTPEQDAGRDAIEGALASRLAGILGVSVSPCKFEYDYSGRTAGIVFVSGQSNSFNGSWKIPCAGDEYVAKLQSEPFWEPYVQPVPRAQGLQP